MPTEDDGKPLLPCPDCRRHFASDRALKTHRMVTHNNPEWVAAREAKRAQQAVKPVPTCPRCGNIAKVEHTQFGPRATCCGLHSWGHKPLSIPNKGTVHAR